MGKKEGLVNQRNICSLNKHPASFHLSIREGGWDLIIGENKLVINKLRGTHKQIIKYTRSINHYRIKHLSFSKEEKTPNEELRYYIWFNILE